LRYLELGLIQRYLNQTQKSPLALALAETEGLPADKREPILAEARRLSRGWKPPQVGDGHAWTCALFGSQEGIVFFLDVLFSRYQDFTADDLAHVLAHVGPKQITPLFLIAMEEDPEPVV